MTRLSVSTGAAYAAVNEPPAGGADATAFTFALSRSATVAASATAAAVGVSVKGGGRTGAGRATVLAVRRHVGDLKCAV